MDWRYRALIAVLLLCMTASTDSGQNHDPFIQDWNGGYFDGPDGVRTRLSGPEKWRPLRLLNRSDINETTRTRNVSVRSRSPQRPRNAPEGYRLWKTVNAKITAYDPSYRSCGIYADGKTSTGKNAWVTDGIAVDPRVIPYGTIVWIPGVGFREADDTGSAMRKSWRRKGIIHIDLRMKFYYQAINWGVKHRKVYLFRPKK